MLALQHGATARQYLKVLKNGLVKEPGVKTMVKHGIVARNGSYEFADGSSPKEETKAERTGKEKENKSPNTSVIRTSNGPITVGHSVEGILKFSKDAVQKEKEAQIH